MTRSVGDDFARVLGDFASGIKRSTEDGDGDDESFKNQSADDPADHGVARVLLASCGEELLIHDLIAEHEEHGGDEKLESADETHGRGLNDSFRREAVIAEELEVLRGQRRSADRPSRRPDATGKARR